MGVTRDKEIVWLTEDRHFALLIQRDAFYSLVAYTREGINYEVVVKNDDYEFWEEYGFDYEQD